MKTIIALVVGIGLLCISVAADGESWNEYAEETFGHILGGLEWLIDKSEQHDKELREIRATRGRLDISNTCIIDNDKKYVLEIDPITDSRYEGHTFVHETYETGYANLTLREVEECPCK